MPDTLPTPRPRYFRFGLRTMFVVLTVASAIMWLGWQAKIVGDRREALKILRNAGADAYNWAEEGAPASFVAPVLPFWRVWMGDAPITHITHSGPLTNQELRSLFPEALEITRSDVRQWTGVL